MNHERQVCDIQIKTGSGWIPISAESGSGMCRQFAIAYTQYKNRRSYHSEDAYHADNGVKVFRENNDHYNSTHVSHENGEKIPIIDMSDVKVFLTDVENANWFKARSYQAWAYRDFVYDENQPLVKYYASRYSSHLFFQTSNYRDVVTIDLDGVSPNIIFKLSRNENGSVYYEKNDRSTVRTRICDNEFARSGYLGFYRRITDFGDFIISPVAPAAPVPHQASHQASHQSDRIKLPLPPGTSIVETENEEQQCIMCFKYKSTIRLFPCSHKVMCPDCYSKMEKGECPICRGDIISLVCENSI